jgi:hypothetical protein
MASLPASGRLAGVRASSAVGGACLVPPALRSRSSISPQTPVNRREYPDIQWSPYGRETTCLQASCGPELCPTFCLPCRRSWVRIPSAASRKGLQIGEFSRPPSSLGLLSRRGLFEDRPGSPPTHDLKLGGFAGEFRSGRTVVILQPPRKAIGSDPHLLHPKREGSLDALARPRARALGCYGDAGRP